MIEIPVYGLFLVAVAFIFLTIQAIVNSRQIKDLENRFIRQDRWIDNEIKDIAGDFIALEIRLVGLMNKIPKNELQHYLQNIQTRFDRYYGRKVVR